MPVNEPTPSLRAIGQTLRSFWRRGRTVERTGYIVGALLVGSGLIHLAILAIGGGSWEGPLSLRKAMSFGLSFGLTLITIVWTASFVRLGARARTALLGLFTVACVVEVLLVSMQAWRGVPSHYNVETAFDAQIARTLAAGGAVLIATIATLTFASFRDNRAVPRSLQIALRIGFVLLSASLLVGALMIAKGMRLVFAGDPHAAYFTGGTLKPTHAVTMHAILVLPALAWLLSFVDWPERRRLNVVLLGTAGYLAFAIIVAIENVAGIAPSATRLAPLLLSALGLLAFVAAGIMTLIGLTRAFTARGIAHD
jgi:hypothetical protein